jgi:hypothetical protein
MMVHNGDTFVDEEVRLCIKKQELYKDLLLLRTRERTPEADEKIPGGTLPGNFSAYIVDNSSLSQTKASSS